jgi:hypothetical protein
MSNHGPHRVGTAGTYNNYPEKYIYVLYSYRLFYKCPVKEPACFHADTCPLLDSIPCSCPHTFQHHEL